MTNAQWQFGFYFLQPLWLLTGLVVIPAIWWGWRSTIAMSRAKRIFIVSARAVCVLLLAAILARPTMTMAGKSMTLIVVFDRSMSINEDRQAAAADYLREAVKAKPAEDRIAFIDVAEDAYLTRLPGSDTAVPTRNTHVVGDQSKLAEGILLALAVAPPDTANRIVLVSDGNETSGDLSESARSAAANKIPVDVVPIRYNYDHEVVFKRMVLPARASSNQTVSVRMVLNSTDAARGTIYMTLNDKPVILDPAGGMAGVRVALRPGTNVKIVSVPIGSRGKYEFEASFVPDKPTEQERADGIMEFDRLAQNNKASGMTFVAGPGHVLILDSLDTSETEPPDADRPGATIARALTLAKIDARHGPASAMPERLADLLDTDSIVMVNMPTSKVSMLQQEMLCRYVTEMGGGLVMVGGPDAFGAGGWIGSPMAAILPVDMDPPQKKQMPQAALVLVIDRSGSMSGKKLETAKQGAIGAVRALSQADKVGVVMFDDHSEWCVSLRKADSKADIERKIRTIPEGGGTTMGPAMRMALEALTKHSGTGVRHVILLTDGQTNSPEECAMLAKDMKNRRISVSTIAVGDDAADKLLFDIAKTTGGQYYHVSDPNKLPQIFIKEAIIVSRSLISEEKFTPAVKDGLSELIRGLARPMPGLDGYIVTTPKGGLDQVVLAHPGGDRDPILATGQHGLGRTVAFTSSADSRWAASWLAWGGFDRFWEQTVRWTSKSAQGADCEINADISGRNISLVVDAVETQGKLPQFSSIVAQIIPPDMTTAETPLTQVGPGEYRCDFQARMGGSHLVNVRYIKAGQNANARAETVQAIVNVPFAPEYDSLVTNESLLADVARRTGGRVLPMTKAKDVNPKKINLFNHDGAYYPKLAQPLTMPLFIAFLSIFLLDVAARRIAVNWPAAWRRLTGIVRSLRPAKSQDATVEKLKARKRKVLDMFAAKGSGQAVSGQTATDQPADRQSSAGEKLFKKKDVSAQKFQAQGEVGELQFTRTPPKPVDQPKIPVSPPPDENKNNVSHLDRLLQAKKKARGDK